MCLECLKNRKLLAIWFSGLFGSCAIFYGLMALSGGVEIVMPGLSWTIGIGPLTSFLLFLVSGFLSAVLCWWSCKQTAKKPRRARR